MRINKFMLLVVLALSVFAFSGCGGSASSDTDEVVYDNKIEEILEGTWKISSSSTGTATTPSGTTTLTLTNPIQTEIIFSDLNLISNSAKNDESGTIYLYYYMNWSAENSGVDAGKFDIRSYTDSNASEKRKLMDIVHSDTNEWILTSRTENSNDSDRITITITLTDNDATTLNWSGNQYINAQKARYNYSFEIDNRKSSTKTTPETVPDDGTTTIENEEEQVKTIKEILTGTWKVTNPYKNIDVNFDDGGSLLLISSDVTFSNINISGDLGTATVSMDQYWRVHWELKNEVLIGYDVDGNPIYNQSTVHRIDYSAFSLHGKTINLTRNPTNTNKWRCDFDTAGSSSEDEAKIMQGTVMNVEIVSDSTIQIVHEGIIYPPELYKQDKENAEHIANFITYDQIDFDYTKKTEE